MIRIIQIENNDYKKQIKELYSEYLEWVVSSINKELNLNFDINDIVKQGVDISMNEFYKFLPPEGCLFLCMFENQIVGLASMRKIDQNIGEIKRMYVRPEFRGKGLGKELLERLIKEAHDFEFFRLRLDTAPFMKEAQGLYKSIGFIEIEPYKESEVVQNEILDPIRKHWIFMEMLLE
jgi:GNAT superfamily N-acetyltransferase